MKTFISLIEEFDQVLRKCNDNNYKKLQDPLPDSILLSYLDQLGVDDENLRLLYGWKNGVKAKYGAALNDDIFKFGALLSLENAVSDYLYAVEDEIWNKKFVPIVSDGDSAHLLFNNEKGTDYGKIYLYCVPMLYIDNPITYYDSLYAMIETTLLAYKEKIMVYNTSNDRLDIDSEKFNKLSKKLNPNSDFWKPDLRI